MLLLFPLLLSFANAQILFQQRIDDQEDFALNENFEEDFTSATERVVSDNPAEDTIRGKVNNTLSGKVFNKLRHF